MTDMQELLGDGCKLEHALHVEYTYYYRSDKMHAKTCTTYKQVKLTTYAKSVSSSQLVQLAI